MANTMRSKKAVLAELFTQFKQYGLTTDTSYEDYVEAVGGDAITRRTVLKTAGGRWPRLMKKLARTYQDVDVVENKVKKASGLDALKKSEKVVEESSELDNE